MAETIIITGAVDTWVKRLAPGRNYGDGLWVQVQSGERRGFVRPPLPNILGRTITSATLYGHVTSYGLDAQTLTYRMVDAHWTQGRMTWNNQPDVNSSSGGTVAIAAIPQGGQVAFDVTADLQSVADGVAQYHGWRLTTDHADWQPFRSTQTGDPAWELHVSFAFDAAEPDDLRPDGGGAVPTDLPILAWDFDDQGECQVQVDVPPAGDDPDDVAPDFDTGWIVSVDPEYDLALSSYVPPGGSAPTFWRVRARDTDGNESGWSDWAEYTVAAFPDLIVDAPTGPIGDPAPTVLAHLSSGAVEQWTVWATGPDRSDVRWRSGVQTGPIDLQIPRKNDDGRRIFREGDGTRGWIRLRVWDTIDRTVAVGHSTHMTEWIEVTFGDSERIAPTSLHVSQQLDGDPRLVWQWHQSDVPESFLIQVDGETVESVGADDMTPVAGVYTWTDGGQVSPLRPHTLAVRAVSDAGRSTAATVANWSHTVEGVWLIPDANIEPVWLAGTAVSGFSQADRTATYVPVKGDPVDITYDWEGMSGTFEGMVDSRQEDVWAALDRIDQLRRNRNRKARLVWGSQSIVVRVRDIHATSSDAILPSNLEHVVRFGFVQVGD